jgi:hypothetical protein
LQLYAEKNYITEVPTNRSIAEIQDALVTHGATGMLDKYEQGTGRIEAFQFLLRIKNQDVVFSLPVVVYLPTADKYHRRTRQLL